MNSSRSAETMSWTQVVFFLLRLKTTRDFNQARTPNQIGSLFCLWITKDRVSLLQSELLLISDAAFRLFRSSKMPINSRDTDFKESFHHSLQGNYQPITWESVAFLSCGPIFPDEG